MQFVNCMQYIYICLELLHAYFSETLNCQLTQAAACRQKQ